MPQAKIGVIGGSGLYHMEGMTDVEEVAVTTPFGDPSDVITIGKVEGVPMAFLPRHGRGHRISPTEIPVRANIWALKSLGRRMGYLGQRRWKPARTYRSPGPGHSQSAL